MVTHWKSFLGALFLFLFGMLEAQQSEFQRLDSLFSSYINRMPDSAAYFLEKQEKVAKSNAEQVGYQLNRALVAMRSSDFQGAQQAHTQALQVADEAVQWGDIYRSQGLLFNRMDQHDSARFYMKKSLQYRKPKERYTIAATYNNISNSFFHVSQPDSAKYYAQLSSAAVREDTSFKSLNLRASNAMFLGQLYLYSSEFDSAFAVCLEAVRLFQEVDNQRGVAAGYSLMGGTFLFQDKFDQARPYYHQALKSAQQVGDKNQSADILHNLGLVLKGQAKLDSAMLFFRRSLSIARSLRAPILQANSSGSLASVFADKEVYDSATVYYEESARLFQATGQPYGYCLSLIGLGKIAGVREASKEALRYLRRGQQLAEQMDNLELKKEAYEGLYLAFEQEGNGDSAFHYFREWVILNDSSQSVEVQERIEALKLGYESELQEEENKRLRTELDLQAEGRANERLRYGLAGALAFALLVIAIGYFAVRNQRQQRIIRIREAELTVQEKENNLIRYKLRSAQESITEKNQLLKRLEEDVQKGVDVMELADRLHERINTNQDWMQFMLEFEVVHQGFFDRLRNRFPGLTQNDQRLACLLRLQLSNKEMAEILNITLEGVKKAKSRLKKKLELDKEARLAEFITQL